MLNGGFFTVINPVIGIASLWVMPPAPENLYDPMTRSIYEVRASARNEAAKVANVFVRKIVALDNTLELALNRCWANLAGSSEFRPMAHTLL